MQDKNYNFMSFHISSITQLIKGMGINKKLIFSLLPVYYLATILNAFIGSIMLLLVVDIFTVSSSQIEDSNLPYFILKFIDIVGSSRDFPDILYLLVSILGLNLFLRFSILAFDGIIAASIRRHLQETIFKNILFGNWSETRNIRVGDTVGTNTQEAFSVVKYLSSVILAIYFILSSIVLLLMAFSTDIYIAFFIVILSIPFIFFFSIQTNLSKEFVMLRNKFSGDITERFNGLLQVNVDNNDDYHFNQGIRVQKRLTRVDVLIGYCQAFIGSFKQVVLFFSIIFLLIFMYLSSYEYTIDLALIASVSALVGAAASQLNGSISHLGNLSRLAGSLYPVLNALKVPSSINKNLINEKVISVTCQDLSYSYGVNKVIENITLSANIGKLLNISGQSGKGKTTLINIIAGLYSPESGRVIYEGISGKKYLSNNFHGNVGYVTQDVHLFGGSLRSNLLAGRNVSDKEIWSVLDKVGASDFVKEMGGIDIETLEAGRSLSGGQKRRLGIARVLISGCNILILDEITSGLDKINKDAIFLLLKELSKSNVVIIISHESLGLLNYDEFKL